MSVEKIFLVCCFTLFVFQGLEAQDIPESCPAGEHLVSGKCELCPPGTFRAQIPVPESLFINVDECQLCPKGTFQAHFGATHNDLCRVCPSGTFSTKEGSAKCEKCPDGETSPKASTECIACPAGSVAFRAPPSGIVQCGKCWRDSFRTLEMHSCQKCPRFMGTERGGASSPNDCVRCEKGTKCSECIVNRYRPSWNSTCIECPRGTYTKGNDASSLSHCLPCPKGTFIGLSEEKCIPCIRGTVVGPAGKICRIPGISCPASFFENKVGDCDTCPVGFRLNRDLLKCEKCPHGLASTGGISESCEACPENQIASQLTGRCVCPAGTYLRGERCTRCEIGTTSYFENRRRSCERCVHGRAPRRGMTECIPCARGRAFDEIRKTCVKCDGENQLIIGTRGHDVSGLYTRCVNARTGCGEDQFPYYTGPGLSILSCEYRACTDRTPEEEIGVKCMLCKKGFRVRNFLGRTWKREKICGKCSYGETSEGGTTTSCVRCPHLQAADERGRCKCEEGLLQSADSCSYCPPGSWSPDGETCTTCRPGFFAHQGRTCRRCERGTYSPGGVLVCLKCPSGTQPNHRRGATACIPS